MPGTYDQETVHYVIRVNNEEWKEVTKEQFVDLAALAGFTRAKWAEGTGFHHFDMPNGGSIEGRVVGKKREIFKPQYPPVPEEED